MPKSGAEGLQTKLAKELCTFSDSYLHVAVGRVLCQTLPLTARLVARLKPKQGDQLPCTVHKSWRGKSWRQPVRRRQMSSRLFA